MSLLLRTFFAHVLCLTFFFFLFFILCLCRALISWSAPPLRSFLLKLREIEVVEKEVQLFFGKKSGMGEEEEEKVEVEEEKVEEEKVEEKEEEKEEEVEEEEKEEEVEEESTVKRNLSFVLLQIIKKKDDNVVALKSKKSNLKWINGELTEMTDKV